MKKITFLFVLFATMTSISYSQVSTYGFANSIGTYTETSAAATLLPAVKADTYMSDAQPIGFSFDYEGTSYTQFKMSSNGVISLNMTGTSALTGNNFSTANADSRPIIAPLWDDLDGNIASAVAAYEVTGAVGSRVLTVEWRNWEWNYSASAAVMSFQVKLYETTNVIEFVYRQEATAISGTATASIGLGSATGSGAGSYLNVTDLTNLAVSSTSSITNLSIKPANNQVLTFSPPAACTGTPVAGVVAPASQILLAGQASATLNVTGQTSGASGLTYQWQQSADGATGWINAIGGSGANSPSYAPPVYAGTPIYYRLLLTCTASALFANSNVVVLDSCPSLAAPTTVETFDTYLPNCWIEAKGELTASAALTFIDSKWASAPSFANATANPAVRINAYGGSPNNDWLISNAIDLGATPDLYRLKYKLAITNWNGTNIVPSLGTHQLRIVVSTDDGATWSTANVLKTYTGAGTYSNTGSDEFVSLTGYSGNIKVGFLVTTSSTSPDIHIHIDDFVVESIPSCVAPSSITASNITIDSADLAWTSAETEFEYVVQTAGTGVPTGSGTANTGTTVTVSGLLGNTNYEIYVRANCTVANNGFSSWTSAVNFATLCGTANVPYSMNFESASAPSLPNCTSQQNVGAGNLWTVQSNPGYGFTTNTLRYQYNITEDADVWFYTQGVNLTAGTTYTVAFDYGATALYPEKLEVAYGTAADAASMTNSVVNFPSVNNGTPNNSSTQITPAADGVYYFGFHAYSDANEFYLFVDNISVDVALKTNTFDVANFSAYPNPVRDVMNISYNKEISNVSVINLLGQVVLTQKVNATQSQIDMSSLQAGAYLVNVEAEGGSKTIKVIKE